MFQSRGFLLGSNVFFLSEQANQHEDFIKGDPNHWVFIYMNVSFLGNIGRW